LLRFLFLQCFLFSFSLLSLKFQTLCDPTNGRILSHRAWRSVERAAHRVLCFLRGLTKLLLELILVRSSLSTTATTGVSSRRRRRRSRRRRSGSLGAGFHLALGSETSILLKVAPFFRFRSSVSLAWRLAIRPLNGVRDRSNISQGGRF
jgi:hypothetical protein